MVYTIVFEKKYEKSMKQKKCLEICKEVLYYNNSV